MATRKHKGLGKGLAALISEDVHFNDSGDIIAGDQAGSEAPAPDQLVFEVAIDKIRPSKGQPRKQFDKQALEELSVSTELKVFYAFVGNSAFSLDRKSVV